MATRRIVGLNSLKKKFDRLPDALRQQIMTAMEKSADEICAMMRTLVPKGETKALYDSIDWTWGSAPMGSMTLASVANGSKEGNLTITIYAGDDDAFYARWVEFGTGKHSVARGGGTKAGQASFASGGGIGHPGSKAQPFFYVSYRANRKRAKSRISRATTAAAKKVAAL